MSTDQITIFTDGSSRGNPGPGGWGSVVVHGDHVIELGGDERETTNNRMELMAAIQGIKEIGNWRLEIGDHAKVTVFTDSSYVINGITTWVKGWKRNGWQTKTKQDVLNRDLWEKLDELTADLAVKWQYVGGHVGILGNERCDHIATAFADGMQIKLYDGALLAYDLPNVLDISLDEARQTKKSSDSSHSRAKAYSYVSNVQGIIETHHTWPECEKRVKGTKGARYKKAIDAADEARIIAGFEAI